MKIKSNNFMKTLSSIVIIFAIACATSLNAQGPPAGPPTGQTDTDDAGDTIPIDGGLAILLAGAAAFGIKKLRDKKTD